MPTFELVERASQMNSYLLFVSLLSLTFVAYARIGTPDAIAVSWKRFWKMSRIESFGFDDDKIRPETQTFLLINFFILNSISVQPLPQTHEFMIPKANSPGIKKSMYLVPFVLI